MGAPSGRLGPGVLGADRGARQGWSFPGRVGAVHTRVEVQGRGSRSLLPAALMGLPGGAAPSLQQACPDGLSRGRGSAGLSPGVSHGGRVLLPRGPAVPAAGGPSMHIVTWTHRTPSHPGTIQEPRPRLDATWLPVLWGRRRLAGRAEPAHGQARRPGAQGTGLASALESAHQASVVLCCPSRPISFETCWHQIPPAEPLWQPCPPTCLGVGSLGPGGRAASRPTSRALT